MEGGSGYMQGPPGPQQQQQQQPLAPHHMMPSSMTEPGGMFDNPQLQPYQPFLSLSEIFDETFYEL